MESTEIIKQHWLDNCTLEDGKEIYLLLKSHINFIIAIVEYMLIIFPNEPELICLQDFTYDKGNWNAAHNSFNRVRMLTLTELEKKINTDKQKIHLLSVIELIYAIIYNSTDPGDPFDDDSGWWLIKNINGLLKTLNDKKIIENAWTIIENEIAVQSGDI